jgi:CRISPR-associated endonuclease/helicase Cas3
LYIAHPNQSLKDHLKGVGTKTRDFLVKLNLALVGELIGLLHDLGKYSEEFQLYIASALGLINPDEDDYVDAQAKKGKVDHSSAGAQYVWEALAEKGPIECYVAQILALCIASHHSGLIDCIAADSQSFGKDVFSKRMGKTYEKTHLDEVKQNADVEILTRCKELLENPELVASVKNILGKICRDNINNNESIQCVQQMQIGLFVRFIFSCLIDADRIDTADAEKKESPIIDSMVSMLRGRFCGNA